MRKSGQVAVFTGWSLLMIFITGALLFVFTFGDCFDDAACKSYKGLAFWLVIAGGFTVYWLVTIFLFVRWNR